MGCISFCKAKVRGLDSRSGHMPGLPVCSSQSAYEREPMNVVSLSLAFSLPSLLSKINK